MATFETQIIANKRRTLALVFCVTLVLCLLGAAAGLMLGHDHFSALWGLISALVIAVLLSLLSYYSGSEILLGIAGARAVRKVDDPELFNVVEEMAIAAGCPMPKIFLIESSALNAFASGRDQAHAAVAITRGLREKLTRDELQGVMAHEMAHITNMDILLSMSLAVMCGLIVIVAHMLRRMIGSGSSGSGMAPRRGGAKMLVILAIGIFFLALAPIISKFLRLAVSRNREYLADATAVKFTRNPIGLASALKKLAEDQTPLEVANGATEHLYIVSPTCKGNNADLDSMWSTHPAISKRLARLKGMGAII